MHIAKQFMSGLSVNLYKGANGKNLAPSRDFQPQYFAGFSRKKALDLRLPNTVPLWAEFCNYLYLQPTVSKVE